jgi:hypothetical protein
VFSILDLDREPLPLSLTSGRSEDLLDRAASVADLGWRQCGMHKEHKARFSQFPRDRQALRRTEICSIKRLLEINLGTRATETRNAFGLEGRKQPIAIPPVS